MALTAPARGARWALWALATVGFLSAMDSVAMSLFLEPVKKEFGLSDTQLGLLSGTAFAVFYACIGLPLAAWADRGNRRNIIALAVAAWSLMTMLCGMASNFVQLMLARVGVGVGEGGANPAAHSMIGDLFPPHLKPKALSVFFTGGYLGMMAGMAGAGWLADHLGWRQGFIVLGLPGLLVAAIFWFTVREPLRITPPAPRLRQSLAGLLQHPRAFIQLTLAFAASSFCTWGLLTFMPSFYVRSHGLSGTQVGLFLGLSMGLGTGIGTVLGGHLATRAVARDRAWGAHIAAVTTLLSVPIYAAQFLTTNIWLSLAFAVVTFIVGGICVGPLYALVQEIVAPDARATAIAVLGLASLLVGKGLAPLVLGAVSDGFSARFGAADALRYALTAGALMSLWPVWHFWRLTKAVRQLPPAGDQAPG